MRIEDQLSPPPTSDQRLIVDTVRDLAASVVAPAAAAIDEAGALPDEMRATLAEIGLFGVGLDEESGGAGFDLTSRILVLHELAAVSGAVAAAVWHSGFAADVLVALSQPSELVERAAIGERVLAIAASRSASDALFVVGGDVGCLTFKGTARAVLGGAHAEMLLLRSNEIESPCLLLTPARDESVATSGEESMLGLRFDSVADITLDSCGVPSGQRFQCDAGPLRRAFQRARTGLAALGAGLARAAMEEALRYSQERVQFGGPISRLEAVKARLARLESSATASMVCAVNAARLMDEGRDAQVSSRVASLQAVEAAVRAGDDALQIFGGYGYSAEYPVERIYRDARSLAWLLEGVDDTRLTLADCRLATA